MSARFPFLRDAIAAQIAALAAYNDTDQVVIGSDEIPAVFPGWRVTMATGNGAPITYNKGSLEVLVYVQLFLGDFTGTQRARQDLIMGHIEAVCSASVTGQTPLTQRVATLAAAADPVVSPRGWNPSWDLEPLDVHDDPRVEAADLPDAQIAFRVRYTLP